jgi:hypothetical protein
MLAFPIALERLQPQPGQFEVPKEGRRIQQFQSDPGRPFDALKPPAEFSIQQQPHILLAAGTDHTTTILRQAYNRDNP